MAILDVLDTTIRTSVKAIIGLPGLTATKMIYAPRRLRGLGVVNCHWEAFLQHFAIASKLAKHRDGLFHQVHNCAEEMKICKQKLGVEGNTSRALRAQLRMRAYEDWSKMPVAGVGVKHFQEFPKGNRFMYVNSSLSNSEWTTALKLSVGMAMSEAMATVVDGKTNSDNPFWAKPQHNAGAVAPRMKPFHMCSVLALMASLCVELDMTSLSID